MVNPSDVIALGALVVSACALYQSYVSSKTANSVALKAPLSQVDYQERRDRIRELWNTLDELGAALVKVNLCVKKLSQAKDYLEEAIFQKALREELDKNEIIYNKAWTELLKSASRHVFSDSEPLLLLETHSELTSLWFSLRQYECNKLRQDIPSFEAFYLKKANLGLVVKV